MSTHSYKSQLVAGSEHVFSPISTCSQEYVTCTDRARKKGE